MFTLPVDRSITEQPIISGKDYYQPVWTLSVRVQPGVMKDFDTWIPRHPHPRFDNQDLTIAITLDDQMLLESTLTTDIIGFESIQHDIDKPTRKLLNITLTGYPQEQQLENNYHAGVVLEVFVNNLPMLNVLENLGQYHVADTDEIKSGGSLMGQNGTQSLEIYMPIYTWLLQHQQHISQYYTSHRGDDFK